ncbi:MAG: hypothetical protein K2L87_02970, partial [Clostridiales bacterium]|nr:hypothetical protein [Clostridiales bacterium]
MPTHVGTVRVKAEVEQTDNYLAGVGYGELVIDRAPMSLEISPIGAVYGTPTQLTVSGNGEEGEWADLSFDVATLVDGTGSITQTGILTPTHVGTVTVTVTAAETENYARTEKKFEITISPRPVTLTWDDLTFEYDGNGHNPTATVTDALEGDTVTVTEYSAPQKNAGKHTASAVDLSNENYTVVGGTNIEQEFEITPLTVILAWSDLEFTYNGQIQHPTATVSNLCGDDKCDVTVLGTRDAGEGLTALATGLSNSNYTLDECTTLTTTFKINPLTAVLGWRDTTLVYNGTFQGPTAYVSNIISPDTCDVTVVGKQVNAGTYTATAIYLSNTNYKLSSDADMNSTEYTIERAPLSIAFETLTTVYGTNLDLSVTGNLGNGEVTYTMASGGTGSARVEGGTLIPVTVGTVLVTVDIEQTQNYKAFHEDLEITITPRPVSLSWAYPAFTYNGTMQAPVATVTNLVNGDESFAVTVEGQTDAGKNLEARATDVANKNYTVDGGENITTTFDIAPLAVEIEWGET